MIYHIAAGKGIEYDRCYRMLNKYSVFMMLLIVTASLVGISSVYQQGVVEIQLLQPTLASPPLPGVVKIQLLPPPVAPPGLPPIAPPGLPPIAPPGLPPIAPPGLPPTQPSIPQPPTPQPPQQESSGGPRVR